VAAEHEDVTIVRSIETLTDLDGGSLAGAVRAQEAEAFSRIDLEIEAVDCYDILVGLTEIANLERWASMSGPHGTES
jgi:hypothetical protein